jgi:RNA polymerase sigma factor (sigma-70 family)
LNDSDAARDFEAAVLPHLDAAYNLARWLARNPQDAEDVAQQALLRALRFFGGFRGGDGRAWLLAIVRNTFHSWLEQNRRGGASVEYDEASAGPEGMDVPETLHTADPEKLALRLADQQLVGAALRALPLEFREILVLRELEGLSYRDISEIIGAPMGTVMSRLSRARDRLRACIETLDPP